MRVPVPVQTVSTILIPHDTESSPTYGCNVSIPSPTIDDAKDKCLLQCKRPPLNRLRYTPQFVTNIFLFGAK